MENAESAGVEQGAAGGGQASVSAYPTDGRPTTPDSVKRRARLGRWALISLDDLGDTTLQWSTGLLATLLGSEMLIVPHQLSSQAYDLVRPHSTVWGGAMLLAGLAMLIVAATGRSRWLVLAAHAGLGTMLLLLGGVFLGTGGWFSAAMFGSLGVASFAAPVLARAPRGSGARADLFAIAIGVAFVLVGLVILGLPDLFASPSFEWMRGYVVWYGTGYAVSGALVVATQLDAKARWWMRWPASLVLVALVLAPLLARSVSQQVWTGLTIFAVVTLTTRAAPALGPLLDRIDPRSLRTRLAVTLAISSALALIAVVIVDTNREESSLRARANASQQTLAIALAHDVADYVELHEGATRALAAMPGLLDDPPSVQSARVRAYGTAYPTILSFAVFDAEGQQVARSDDRARVAATGAPWFERVRMSLRPVRVVARSTTLQRTIFAYAVAINDQNGRFQGAVAATVESTRIADQLSRVVADPNQRAYLVDNQGRTIAHPDVSLIASFADLSDQPPVASLLADDDRAGSLVYAAGRDEWLAGYARVPGLDWGVVVEQPTSVALASVREGRERALAALILVVCVAVAIGAVTAGWLMAPLAVLSLAVRRLADGSSDSGLGNSGITEISRLAGAFGEMRERLAARTVEHERSEAALRESEQRFRTMANSAPILIWTSGTDALCTFFNDGWLQFTGRTIQEELGDGWAEGVHEDDLRRCLQVYRSSFQARRPFTMEYRLRRADGEYRWIVDEGAPRFEPDGTFAGYIGSCIDITERRRAEEVQQLLAEAGSQLVSSLDHQTTLQGIAQLVAVTIADYCVVQVQNEDGTVSTEVAHADAERLAHVQRLLGVATLTAPVNGVVHAASFGGIREPSSPGSEAVAPRAWSDRSILVPAVGEAGRDAALVDVLATLPWAAAGEVDAGTIVQELGVCSLICVPLPARDRTIGCLTLIAAESGRRYGPKDLELAEALAARAALAVDNARLYSEAQAAIRARDEFLSIASHELRTPVTGIKGYAQLLLRAQERSHLEAARLTRSLHAIDDATDRLTTLTQDLLDVSRIRLGQLPLRLHEIDLSELVRRVGYRFADQLPPGIDLIVDLQSPVPPIQGDADRLEQVFSNLLDNAVKYSPGGGTVRVELGRVGGEIRVAVRDQGIGLPSDAASSIFRPFGRAPNASSRNLPGMGLGLYICRNIVERHGGRVSASSPGEGLGTTIEVTLPIEAPPQAPLTPTNGTASGAAKAPGSGVVHA
jgi:PAS domain S-box-containing protein